MRNVIVAVLLFLILGIVASVLFTHWWSSHTVRLPIEQNVIATSEPSSSALPGITAQHPLARDEKAISLPSSGSLPAGTIRYTPTGKTVTFTVLVSSETPKTAVAWVMPAKGQVVKLGTLRVGKDGLFIDATISTSQLPAHIVITTAKGRPTVAGEALFDTILSL